MKKLLFLLFAALPWIMYAQNSPLEDVQEVSLSKNELFAKTKMFISDKWNNPKRSILNEDKEAGIIQVKTEKEFSYSAGMGLKCIYKYEYMTKFRLKDNKYKIEFYDINCISAVQTGLGSEYSVPLIPYFTGDNAPDTKKSGRGISKKKAIEMMNELREEFSTITTQYKKYLDTKDDDF